MGTTESLLIQDWAPAKLTVMNKLGTIVHELQKVQPINMDGIPTQMVLPAAIAATGLTASVENFLEEPPTGCIRTVIFQDGIPTLEGIPIWERFDEEPIEYYKYYTNYQMIFEKNGYTSLPETAKLLGVSVAALQGLARAYHWSIRVRAYARYQEAMYAAIRRKNQRITEGEHFQKAKALANKCADILLEDEYLCKMDPKDLIATFKIAAELQRISVGLSPTKPAEDTDGNNNGTGGGGMNFRGPVQINNYGKVEDTPEKQSRALEIARILKDAGVVDILPVTAKAAGDNE